MLEHLLKNILTRLIEAVFLCRTDCNNYSGLCHTILEAADHGVAKAVRNSEVAKAANRLNPVARNACHFHYPSRYEVDT